MSDFNVKEISRYFEKEAKDVERKHMSALRSLRPIAYQRGAKFLSKASGVQASRLKQAKRIFSKADNDGVHVWVGGNALYRNGYERRQAIREGRDKPLASESQLTSEVLEPLADLLVQIYEDKVNA